MEIINIDKDCEIVLDTQSKEIEVNINKCKVVISDMSFSNKIININEGELDYCFIKKNGEVNTNQININSSSVKVRVLDLYKENSKIDYQINLNSEESNFDLSIASISKKNVNKSYKIKTNNNVRYTNAKIDCFGIVEDKSSLEYDITSFIKKGAKQSIVNQNSKILLFDKESIGINNPILEIEENDVKANHGSSIGMIDEETLFYLTSRGISESDARNLVSIGRVSYLIDEVKDEKIKKDLLNEVLKGVWEYEKLS